MPIIQAQKDLHVFVDEDFKPNEVSEDIIGRKALSLFKLRHMDVPVPPFMAVSSAIFSQFITDNAVSSIKSKISADELRKNIQNGQFSEETQAEILGGYARISGFADAWVAVRSSIVLPVSKRELSFAGQLGTILNVRGFDNLLSAIKQVYATAFSDKVANYLMSNGMTISDIKVGIVIQKMVQAEVSGIAFTEDPISQDPNLLTLEAIFGLGDSIANGELTPDQYTVDKKTLEIKEKRIVPQEWMTIRKIRAKANENAEQKVKISRAWQQHPKLENRYIEELSKIAIVIEKRHGCPQDIEWVFEGGRLWILQSRNAEPVKIPQYEVRDNVKISDTIISSVQEIVHREEAKRLTKEEINAKHNKAEEKKEEPKETKAPIKIPFLKKAANKPVAIIPKRGEKLLLTGIGSSNGMMRGKAFIIGSAAELSAKTKDFNKDSILVVEGSIPGQEQMIDKVGAVISDSGGLTSDIAITCREKKIPCVMGCNIASRMLKDGETLLVDGTIGAVYGTRESVTVPVVPPQKAKLREAISIEKETKAAKKEAAEPAPVKKINTATKVYLDISDAFIKGDGWKKQTEFADGIGVINLESLYEKLNRHPVAFIMDGKAADLVNSLTEELSNICEAAQGNPVIVSIGKMTVGQYKKLTRGKLLENWDSKTGISDNTAGLPRLLLREQELDIAFRAIKKVRNVKGWRNLSIAVDFAGTPTNLAEFKKLLTAGGLRRSSTFKLYLGIDTPSEALVADAFVKTGIDGMIANTKSLMKLMMAGSADDESVQKIVENLVQESNGLPVIIQIPKNADKLLKKCIKVGVHAVATTPILLNTKREAVVKLEQERITTRL